MRFLVLSGCDGAAAGAFCDLAPMKPAHRSAPQWHTWRRVSGVSASAASRAHTSCVVVESQREVTGTVHKGLGAAGGGSPGS